MAQVLNQPTKYSHSTLCDRSTPYGLHHQAAVLGLHFYDGYVNANANTFTDFYDDAHKIAGAISFKAMRSIRATFTHSFFDFEDGLEGNYVKGLPKYSYAAHKSEYRGLAYDADGTITGWSGVTIVPDRPFFTSSLCEARPHWGNILSSHLFSTIFGTHEITKIHKKCSLMVTKRKQNSKSSHNE